MERMMEPQERLLRGITEVTRQTGEEVVRVGLLALEVNLTSDDVCTQLEQLDTLGLVRFTRGHAGDDVVILLWRGHAALATVSTASAR